MSSLYKYILKIFPNVGRLNIKCKNLKGNIYNFVMPPNISISQLIFLIKKILHLDHRYYFNYNGKIIISNDNTKLIKFFNINENPTLTFYKFGNIIGLSSFKGEEIKVTMFFKNKEIFKSKIVYKYEPINILYDGFDDEKISKIFVNGLLVSKDDHRSLASFGINNDFFCCIAE